MTTKHVELRIEGMSCQHCVRAVKEALTGVDGVRVAEVAVGSARVECDENVSRDALAVAIADAGFALG